MRVFEKAEEHESMRILYVVSRPLEINTSASIRNKATINGLLGLGHEVDLVTTQFDKNHSNFDSSILNENLNVTYFQLNGIQNVAKMGRRYKQLQPIKNILYKVYSRFEVYDNLKGIVNSIPKMDITDETYDLIISSSDPKSSHLFVHKLFEKKIVSETPWIQIWGDPFFSDITRTQSLLNRKIRKEESKLLRYAKKIIYVSELTLREQRKAYKTHSRKMYYVPIPYVEEKVYDLKRRVNRNLTFLYCGDYSTNVRTIKNLYNAFNNSDHKLIICGDSNIKLESTANILIYPRVSYEITKKLEKESDVLIHLSNLKGTQIPGKIYQYSGTNKLILFILDGEKNLIFSNFEKYKRYIFADNNVPSIKKVVSEINNNCYDHTQFVLKDFSPITIAGEIIDI